MIVGTFSLFHIIYMLIAVPLFVGGLILIKKFVKSEKTINLILDIAAGVLLTIVVIERIDIVYENLKEGTTYVVFGETRGYNWWMLLPDSICGLCSLLLPFFIWFKRKGNNYLVESLFTVIMIGTLVNIFYPSYINDEPINQVRCWGGLVHHYISGFLAMLMLLFHKFEPSIKRWYLNIIALTVIIAYGYFCITVLKFAKCMYIEAPLFESVPFSRWYGMYLVAYIPINIIFLVVWELIKKYRAKKKSAIVEEQ